ncbi:hypothetical protein B0T11DRAFT_353915 [Plectosphaerella cucumerina]|uniref:Zn(2)-C6 fungal-type domain-containing protein n=1 Tax=Plectosphaerella cucumerina TaxID=40658 RepID=A0A8K0TLA8_9PEZI|nr:hypothetical protein B0T11DRAFT_353915 [Plectosphaerella cucumerina]
MSFDGPPPMPSSAGYSSKFPLPVQQQQQQPPPPPPQPIPYEPHPYQPETGFSNHHFPQACDYCRQLKARCDKKKPCMTCREKGAECVYRESIPKPSVVPPLPLVNLDRTDMRVRSDKSQADILDGINDLKRIMEAGFSSFHERINNLERPRGLASQSVKLRHDAETAATSGASHTPTAPMPLPPTPMADDPCPYPDNAAVSHQAPQPFTQNDTPQTVYTPADDAHMTHDDHLNAQMEEDDEEDAMEHPLSDMRPGETSIPLHHTTSAGHLLASPSIKKLTQHFLERKNIHSGDFPQWIEERRGILRLYGRGEDHGRGESATTDYGHVEVEIDTYSEPGSSPADWGRLGSTSPQTSADYKSSTLNSWRQPDYRKETVMRYVKSCEANVLGMHPIICKGSLHSYADQLLEETAQRIVKTAIGKRNRSSRDKSASPGSRPGAPSRSPETAVILAAIALGKLSPDRGNIADVTSSETTYGHTASPAQEVSLAHSQSSGFMSPRESGPNRRQSWQSSWAGLGLATDIVGNQVGGFTIQHIQANILIALYYGEIGYVIQSSKYIQNASWALQVNIRRNLPRLNHECSTKMDKTGVMVPPPKQKPKDRLLLMTFWTDIVVELSSPQSGILSYEELTPYPDPVLDYGERVAASYLAQLHIRKKLNYISKTFYSEDPRPVDVNGHDTIKVTVNEVRNSIRMNSESESSSWLYRKFRFEERGPPASDMLSARLRAKYWGFQVLCTRPFAKKILDFSCQLEDGYPEIVGFVKDGINALIASTKAFQNLGTDRLLLTNFFGTAIAQWGNLLVLAACHRDRFLGKFVNEAELRLLFDRTISWISKVAQPSSSLAVAIRMLDDLRNNNFAPPSTAEANKVSRSFSSSTMGGALKLFTCAPTEPP